jgi:hypothetical protein
LDVLAPFAGCTEIMSVPDRPVIAQMRRTALRLLLVIAVLNAAVLSAASLTTAAGARGQTALAAAVALALAGWPLSRADQLEEDLSRRPWLSAVAAALGGLMLAVDPGAHRTMFAAFLTPVGVCVLVAYWRQAVVAAALVTGGYVVASIQPGIDGSLEAAISDILPVFVLIATGVVPARIAFRAIRRRNTTVKAWRAAPDDVAQISMPGKPGISRQHDAAILAGVLAGKSDKEMAVELGMGKASWRVRDRRQRMQREHGVESRRALAKLLHESTMSRQNR